MHVFAAGHAAVRNRRREDEMKKANGVWAVLAVSGAVFSSSVPAHAGIEACGNIRLEDVGSCDIRGNVQCSGSCSELGVYRKSCATKLHTVCRQDCTLKADATC